MKRSLTIVALLLWVGCSTQRPSLRSVETRDSTYVREIEYMEVLRDTIIYVTLPAESRESLLFRDSSRLETSLAISLARIEPDGNLYHTLHNKPQSKPVTVAVRERTTLVAEQKETGSRTVVEVPVRLPLRGWEKFLTICGALFCGILLGGIVFMIIRLFR